MACGVVNDQYGTSRWKPVGLPNGSLISAWSCQMRTPVTPDSSVAARPTSGWSTSRRTSSLVCQRLMRCVNTRR
jgi:hypothetical protein